MIHSILILGYNYTCYRSVYEDRTGWLTITSTDGEMNENETNINVSNQTKCHAINRQITKLLHT